MNRESGLLKHIKDAIEHGTDLQIAVDKALSAYTNLSHGKLSQDLVSLKPRSRIDHLLESLLSLSHTDERYLPVFDLIRVREPENVNVLEAKGLAWFFVNPREAIDAHIHAIALLEGKGGHEKHLPGLYKVMAQAYNLLKKYDKAIGAYSMAMDYTVESEGRSPRYYRAMRMRAYMYLKIGQEDEARKDAHKIYNEYGRDVLPELLERFEREKQRKY